MMLKNLERVCLFIFISPATLLLGVLCFYLLDEVTLRYYSRSRTSALNDSLRKVKMWALNSTAANQAQWPRYVFVLACTAVAMRPWAPRFVFVRSYERFL